MRLVAGGDAGVRVAYDDVSTPIRDCFVHGKIGQHQLTAGEQFERLCRVQNGSPGPRSCLDWQPRGNGETETEYKVRLVEMWKDACRHVGMETSSVLMSVCFFHEGTGPRRSDARRWRRFTEGLDMLADFWGIQREALDD